MNNGNTIILDFLSAGVIASLVTGLFSLIVSIKNNKRLIELENNRQEFTLKQERYKGFKDAYTELINILPQDNLLGYFIINLSLHESTENILSEIDIKSERNMKIIYNHFQKYGYLFSSDEQQKITNLINTIDAVSKNIININLKLQVYDDETNKDIMLDKLYKSYLERAQKVAELENVYYNLFKNNLSQLSK